MIERKLIGVYFPKGAETGGPEALHQLVDSLRRHGIPAVLIPMPGTEGNTPVEQYRPYNAPIDVYTQNLTHVVVPEICPELLKLHPNAKKYVWWLAAGDPTGLEHYSHLAQSKYAQQELKKRGIEAKMLSDYTSFLDDFENEPGEKRGIAYNANKGAEYVEPAKALLPDVEFIPINGMSRSQVLKTLSDANAYLDLGHHPGKDRMPREAAALGCVVVTSTVGSASVYKDVPIAEKVLRDDPESVARVVESINSDALTFWTKQRSYREKVFAEPYVFDNEVREIFG